MQPLSDARYSSLARMSALAQCVSKQTPVAGWRGDRRDRRIPGMRRPLTTVLRLASAAGEQKGCRPGGATGTTLAAADTGALRCEPRSVYSFPPLAASSPPAPADDPR